MSVRFPLRSVTSYAYDAHADSAATTDPADRGTGLHAVYADDLDGNLLMVTDG